MKYTIKYKNTDGDIETVVLVGKTLKEVLAKIKNLKESIYTVESPEDDVIEVINGTLSFDKLKHLHNAKVRGYLCTGKYFKEGIIKITSDERIYIYQNRHFGNECFEYKTQYKYSWIIAGKGITAVQFEKLEVFGFDDQIV